MRNQRRGSRPLLDCHRGPSVRAADRALGEPVRRRRSDRYRKAKVATGTRTQRYETRLPRATQGRPPTVGDQESKAVTPNTNRTRRRREGLISLRNKRKITETG